MQNSTLRSRRSVWIVAALVTVLAILAVSASSAQQPEPKAPSGASFQTRSGSFSIGDTTILPGAFPRAPFSITQSVDTTTITQFNSVSCNAGGLHADNHYYRVFDLAADFGITGAVDITSIDLGIEQALGATGDQPISIDLYTSTTNPPTLASMTLIQANPQVVADASLVVQNFVVTGSIPASSILVVDVFTPDGQTAGNSFFIGSNAAGQNDPSYIASSACGITEPTDLAAIGFGTMHIVMVVNGDDGGAGETATPTDEPTSTPGGPTETPTDEPTATPTDEPPGTELIVNGDFENLGTDGKPDVTPWVVKNSTGDKAKCNKDKDGDGIPDKIFANTGDCAFQFKGVPSDAGKIQQTLDLTGVTMGVGDTLNLTLAAQTKGAGLGKGKLVFKYADDTKTKIAITITNTSDVYAPFTGSETLTSADVAKAKINFKMTTESGKVYIDSVSLRLVGVGGVTETPTEEATVAETETPVETETPTETAAPRLNGSRG